MGLAVVTGRRWKADSVRHLFAAVRTAAAADCPSLAGGEGGLAATFQDLRDTAVTRLAEAGCTIAEIAAITRHAEHSVYDVLKHYLALGQALADTAIAKLVDAWDRRQPKNENGTELDASN